MSDNAAKSNNEKKLRLEWVEAGTLSPNPKNWRRHSETQQRAIKSVLNDPEIGWAGVLLYNERTKRLIDGHARQQAVNPKDLVPVLIGNWSDEAEAKILLTLDPLGSMADGSRKQFEQLLDSVSVEDADIQKLLADTAGSLTPEDVDSQAAAEGLEKKEVELKPFKCTHILLSFPPDLIGEVEKHIAPLRAIQEVQYETSSN
jgi:hypothetical protein